MNYKIEEKKDAIRIDKYLKEKLDISRNKLQEMIQKSLVLVNNKSTKNSYILRINDEIQIKDMLKHDTTVKPENMDIDIIYEDDDLMIINKPSGMVVHPSFGHYSNTLVNGLLAYTNKLSTNNGDIRPGIVHRIDKDTSGLLIVAKNDKAHDILANQLKDKTLSRIYIALVKGKINHDTGEIDAPIGRDKYDRKKMTVTDENAKEAITYFKVLERYKNTTLIECKLKTGRTHQIRVHLNYINHPIINDPVYGDKKMATDFGQMLHAKSLTFIHPTTKKEMTFTVDAPKEFYEILNKYKDE